MTAYGENAVSAHTGIATKECPPVLLNALQLRHSPTQWPSTPLQYHDLYLMQRRRRVLATSAGS